MYLMSHRPISLLFFTQDKKIIKKNCLLALSSIPLVNLTAIWFETLFHLTSTLFNSLFRPYLTGHICAIQKDAAFSSLLFSSIESWFSFSCPCLSFSILISLLVPPSILFWKFPNAQSLVFCFLSMCPPFVISSRLTDNLQMCISSSDLSSELQPYISLYLTFSLIPISYFTLNMSRYLLLLNHSFPNLFHLHSFLNLVNDN